MLVQAFSSFWDIHRMWSSTSMMLLAISTITSVSWGQRAALQRAAAVPRGNTPILAFPPQKHPAALGQAGDTRRAHYLLDLVHVADELLYHLRHIEDINHVREVGCLGRVHTELVSQGQGVGGVDGHLWGGTATVTISPPLGSSRAAGPLTHQHEGVEHTGDVVGVEAAGIIAVLPAPGAVTAPPRLLLARRARGRRPRGERVLQAGLEGRDPRQGAGPPAATGTR